MVFDCIAGCGFWLAHALPNQTKSETLLDRNREVNQCNFDDADDDDCGEWWWWKMIMVVQVTSSQTIYSRHPTMLWRNKPHNQFILHCELLARMILCICTLPVANGISYFLIMMCKYLGSCDRNQGVGLRATLTFLDLKKSIRLLMLLICFHNCFSLHCGMWLLACAYVTTNQIRHILDRNTEVD